MRFVLYSLGGGNFLLRHKPVLTFDVDFWIEDTEINRRRCEVALSELAAEWGTAEFDWGPVALKASGWLSRQSVYCLTSPHGAIDIFRSVKGLSDWNASFNASVLGKTASGIAYRGLSDQEMLACQLSLPPESRKNDRIRELEKASHE